MSLPSKWQWPNHSGPVGSGGQTLMSEQLRTTTFWKNDERGSLALGPTDSMPALAPYWHPSRNASPCPSDPSSALGQQENPMLCSISESSAPICWEIGHMCIGVCLLVCMCVGVRPSLYHSHATFVCIRIGRWIINGYLGGPIHLIGWIEIYWG